MQKECTPGQCQIRAVKLHVILINFLDFIGYFPEKCFCAAVLAVYQVREGQQGEGMKIHNLCEFIYLVERRRLQSSFQ